MQLTGTIADVRPGGTVSTQHGDLTAYYLSINSNPPIPDGYLRAKTYTPQVGEEITVNVDNPAEKGAFLKKVNPQYEGGGKSGSGGGQPSNPDREKRIVRQHSQEMALRFLTLIFPDGAPRDSEGGLAPTAENALSGWIDWFDRDAFSTSARPGLPSKPDTAEPAAANGADNAAASSPAALGVPASDDDPIF